MVVNIAHKLAPRALLVEVGHQEVKLAVTAAVVVMHHAHTRGLV